MSGLAIMRGKFKCQGVLPFRIIGQRAYCACSMCGSCCLEILSLNTVFKGRLPPNKQLIKIKGKAVKGISISLNEFKKRMQLSQD